MAPTDVIPNLPRPQTPPSSPELPAYKLSSGYIRLFVDLLKAAQAIQSAPAAAAAIQPASTGEKYEDKKASRSRASKVEFKTVNEVYVTCEMQNQKAKITTPQLGREGVQVQGR